MGQQQLLLIVLGVIIVGIAIAVGISMFKSNAQSSNRDQVINDLNNLAAKAQQFYRKPTSMAGGGQSFVGFILASIDTSNANGLYAVTDSTTAPAAYAASTYSAETATKMYITGWGTEVGNDGTNKVEAVVMITNNAINTRVVN